MPYIIANIIRALFGAALAALGSYVQMLTANALPSRAIAIAAIRQRILVICRTFENSSASKLMERDIDASGFLSVVTIDL